MDQSLMLKKNDPVAKSEVNLPVFNLANKQPVKKQNNDVRRVSNMDMLQA